ncbi:hypothetical protein [Chitinophaga defluvii]|uniref:Uncharacterized protein n=1 Tax=Chitinophaga defluvii TaxID=3163343 RepID=A0ABV2TCG6_9BACT
MRKINGKAPFSKLERGYPHQVVFFGNTPFEIHDRKKKFVEFGRRENIIDQRQLRRRGDKYVFVFDRKQGRLVEDPVEVKEGYEQITVPFFIAQLKAQISDLWELNRTNQVFKELGYGVHLADAYLIECYQGRPVEYDLEGTIFRLDVKRGCLIQKDNEQNVIDLLEMPCAPISGYELMYDPGNKNIDTGDPVANTSKLIFFDQMVNCDPLGMAKKYDISISRLPDLDMYLNSPETVSYCQKFNGDLKEIKSLEKPNSKRSQMRR